MESVLQFFGLVGLATLGVICVILALPKYRHILLVTGHIVFGWLALTVITLTITRTLSLPEVLELIPIDQTRAINSVVFLTSLAGIIWSVSRHARKSAN